MTENKANQHKITWSQGWCNAIEKWQSQQARVIDGKIWAARWRKNAPDCIEIRIFYCSNVGSCEPIDPNQVPEKIKAAFINDILTENE